MLILENIHVALSNARVNDSRVTPPPPKLKVHYLELYKDVYKQINSAFDDPTEAGKWNLMADCRITNALRHINTTQNNHKCL